MFNYELPDLTKLTAADLEGNSPLQDYISKQLMALLTQKQNLHGRRVGKAKDAISPGDYVTKRQLNGTLVGTVAQRPQAANVVEGTTYYATDRGVTYIMRGGHWYYYLGIQEVTLNPNTKPSPSILYDYGYLIYATDFDWYYEWVLTGWRRLGGANLYIEGFKAAPTKAGWHLMDGTASVVYSKDDGTTGTINLENFILDAAHSRVIRFGPAAGDVAAVAPTLSGSTGIESVPHTHYYTPTGSISGTAALPDLSHGHDEGTLQLSSTAVSGSITGGGEDCSTVFGSEGGGVSVVNCGATYELSFAAVNSGDVTGFTGGALGFTEGGLNITVTADFTGNTLATDYDSVDHTHPVGTLAVSSTGEPLTYQLIPYIRL